MVAGSQILSCSNCVVGEARTLIRRGALSDRYLRHHLSPRGEDA